MFYKTVLIILCIVCLPFPLNAQEESPISVIEMTFCRGIELRNPVDGANSFPNSVERVFCYNKLSGSENQTTISHVWYYNDTQMAIVDLPVNGKTWRTWSSKRIVREWTGTWRVDVISSTGNVILSDEFIISAEPE